jgi:hypothetical protein
MAHGTRTGDRRRGRDIGCVTTRLRHRLLAAAPIVVGVGYALGLLITNLGFRLLGRWRRELASVLSTFVAGPVQLLTIVLLLSLAHALAQPSLTMSRLLTALEQILLIIAVAWMILRLLESLEEIARSHALRRDKTILRPLLPVVRRRGCRPGVRRARRVCGACPRRRSRRSTTRWHTQRTARPRA